MNDVKKIQQMLAEAHEKGRNEGIREALQRLLIRLEGIEKGTEVIEKPFKDIKNVLLYSELVRKLKI
jgi:hypothetical protein